MPVSEIESILWTIFKFCAAFILLKIIVDQFYYRRTEEHSALDKKTHPEYFQNGDVVTSSSLKEKNYGAEVYKPADGSAVRKVKKAIISSPRLFQGSHGGENKRIGEILLEHNLITKNDLDRALEHQKQHGGSITQYLLHYGLIDEEELATCLSSKFGVPYLPLGSYNLSKEVIDLIPTDIAEKYWVLPVEKQGDILTVVMIDPLDTKAIKELEDLTGMHIIPFVGIISEILKSLKTHYKLVKTDHRATMPSFLVNTKTYAGIDRRAYIRYHAKIDIKYPFQGSYIKTQTFDICREGVGFKSARALKVGEVLPLEIALPPKISGLPITAVAQVIRCVMVEGGGFEIGLRLLKISKKDIGIIINYAASQHTT